VTPERWLLLLLNAIGGICVLGSYLLWIGAREAPGAALWGGVPESWRGLYSVSMFGAAAGYFAFTSLFLFATPIESARIHGLPAGPTLLLLYALMLFASALWMPLSFEYLAHPSLAAWCAVRFVLAVVALASLALIAAAASIDPVASPTHRAIAVAGACAFAFQTAVLDALVWPAYFSR
jgi:hypothetical protein